MSATATREISEWLEKLGVVEYSERFTKNEIDVSVLYHLTDQDLKEVALPLGHRRKMLARDQRGCCRYSHRAGPARCSRMKRIATRSSKIASRFSWRPLIPILEVAPRRSKCRSRGR